MNNIKVTFFSRCLITILTPFGTLLFLTFFALFTNFLTDFNYLDKYGLPRISRNPNFNICDKLDCKILGEMYTKLAFNGIIIAFFWLHHILMANDHMKELFRYIMPSFGIIERSLYIVGKL